MEHISRTVSRTLGTLTATPVMPPTIHKLVKPLTWGFKTPNQNLKDALNASQQFCADMFEGRLPYWLCLVGKSGTGKTHLAKKIKDWFSLNLLGDPCQLIGSYQPRKDYRFRTWQKAMGQIYEGNFGVVEALSEEWLAVIDDIGAEHDPRKFGVAKLLEILNHRRDKWTVMTSNLTTSEIAEHLDARLASRLIRDGSKVIEITAKDFNL